MKSFLLLTSLTALFFTGCTNSSLTPISNAKASNYSGEATILIAVDGTDSREVRHIELGTKEETEGYEIYFHDKKYSEGFIVLTLPTPSSEVRLVEYSLTGMYGCSRGKAGYGYGTKVLPKIENGKTYFLGTINTSMNTMYKEMPEELYNEAKSDYHYTPHDTDLKEKRNFKSNIKL
jgi:hypothetical protein